MAGTATGRLSCQNPNLMQLPKASEDEGDLSNAVRDFFEAAPGYSFISCDYVN
jgi:DNA polymerase I-like protein with 3'-5' exonuclease and polymerase domains